MRIGIQNDDLFFHLVEALQTGVLYLYGNRGYLPGKSLSKCRAISVPPGRVLRNEKDLKSGFKLTI